MKLDTKVYQSKLIVHRLTKNSYDSIYREMNNITLIKVSIDNDFFKWLFEKISKFWCDRYRGIFHAKILIGRYSVIISRSFTSQYTVRR